MPITKTWCQPVYSLHRSHPWYDEEWRTAMWLLKEALVNATVGAWTVVASADRSVVGLYDTWTSWDKVDWRNSLEVNANPGSWMLLKSPTGARGPFWLLYEISSTSVGVGTHTRFWILTREPDLSNLVEWRLPPIADIPRVYSSCAMAITSSGSPDSVMDCIVADDGSFCFVLRINNHPQGGYNYPVSVVIFNLLDDVPPQDPYGFMFLTKNDLGSDDDQNSAEWSAGVGLDPDGVSSVRAMVRNIGINTGGTINANFAPSKQTAEDPSWGKYYSERIPVFCSTAGREGFRGTLSDMWWSPYVGSAGVLNGSTAWLDTSTKVCCVQPFWLPCPGDPWIL